MSELSSVIESARAALDADGRSGDLVCLLVDDSRFDRKRVRYVAERSGLRIRFIEAGTVAEAREVLDRDYVDFILLDNYLPDGQGLGLAVDLADRGIPVIMLSGQPDNGLAEAAIWAGMSRFISKDALDPELLAETVQEAVIDARPRRDPDVAEVPFRLAAFARDCAREMGPPIQRLAALIHDLQGAAGEEDMLARRRILAEMEELCGALGEYVEEMGQGPYDA